MIQKQILMKLTVKVGIVAMCVLFIPGCITLQVESVKTSPSTLKNLPPVLVVARDLNEKTPRTLVDLGWNRPEWAKIGWSKVLETVAKPLVQSYSSRNPSTTGCCAAQQAGQ